MKFKFHKFDGYHGFSARSFLDSIKEKHMKENYNNINTNAFQLAKDEKLNEEIKAKIISEDLEQAIQLQNFDDIMYKFLPLMLSYNSYYEKQEKEINENKDNKNDEENNKNPILQNKEKNDNLIEYSNIISTFQQLLKNLYDIEKSSEKTNKYLNETLTKLKEPEKKIEKYKQKITEKKEVIEEIKKKETKLKIFLKKNGVVTKGRPNVYFCDVCPYQKFSCYQDLHNHYVKKHIDPNLDIGTDYTLIREVFDSVYFDKKIDDISEEIMKSFIDSKQKKKKVIDKDFEEKKKAIGALMNTARTEKNMPKLRRVRTIKESETNFQKNMNNYEKNTINNKNNNEEVNDLINQRIQKIKNEEENYKKFFQNQMNSFMEELKNQLDEIKNES